MSKILVLRKLDRALLALLLVIFLCGILFATFVFPSLFLIVAFNAFFLFNIIFHLMLYLNKKDFGKSRASKRVHSVAVVIPVFNSINTIKKCINSIKKIKYPKKIHIIVVDDCSTDGTREYLKKIKGIDLVNLEKNSGKAIALARGIERAKEEFVVTIDSDSYPEENILIKTLGYFEDESVGAVSCLVLPDKNKTILQRIQYLEYLVGFGLGNTLLSSINSSYVVPGPFTIFKRKVFDVVGHFEPGNLAEDMEFGFRLKSNSFKIANCYEAVVHTDIPSTWKGLFVQRDRWYRGAASNFVRYKRLLFNKENPDFGFFVMPFIFVSQILIVVVLARLLIFFFKDFYVFLSVVVQYFSLGGSVFIDLSTLVLPPTLILFLVSYVFIGFYFWLCFRTVKYSTKLSDVFPLLMLIFIYPYFISVTYSQGYMKEIFGVQGKWRRVST